MRRLGKDRPGSAPFNHDEVVSLVSVLLSFDNFDALAGAGRTPEEVTPMMQKLARLVVGA
jgi:hypothetical protein